MFLLPLALTIFGCSTLSGLRERFSAGAGAAASSFFAFGAAFFFGSTGVATDTAGDASALAASPWTSVASSFGAASFAATLGALGFFTASSAGFVGSTIKLSLLWRLCCG